MANVHSVSIQRGELANEALELLMEAQKHVQACRQCAVDPSMCDTAKTYAWNYDAAFKRWSRS